MSEGKRIYRLSATDPRDPRLVQTHIAAQEGEFIVASPDTSQAKDFLKVGMDVVSSLQT